MTGEIFVRDFQSAPNNVPVLAINIQVNIMIFCVLPKFNECAHLPVNLTFNLGDYYITATSYKNKFLKNKERNNTVHIDPVQIYYCNLDFSYRFLGSSLK